MLICFGSLPGNYLQVEDEVAEGAVKIGAIFKTNTEMLAPISEEHGTSQAKNLLVMISKNGGMVQVWFKFGPEDMREVNT